MEYALIVAGGKGLRMGGELPKQFLPIGGKPVLMRTLEAFYAYNPEIHIILVLPHRHEPCPSMGFACYHWKMCSRTDNGLAGPVPFGV